MRLQICSLAAVAALALNACSTQRSAPDEHDHGDSPSTTVSTAAGDISVQQASLPAGAGDVADRLTRSPRHRELVRIATGPGDSVDAWIVHPERPDNAPVVIVIHEIFGVSKWIIGVADQLAADGFIAIAPNLLTGTVDLQQDTTPGSAFSSAIRAFPAADIHRRLAAVGQWGMALPSAVKKYGVVGYCWGGGASVSHAIFAPEGLGAAVSFYGTPIGTGSDKPVNPDFSRIQAPVLALYAGNDQRINATAPQIDSTMKAHGKSYEAHFFEGAGHGFLRQQPTPAPNFAATEKAWPLTVEFFRRHLR